MRTKDVSQDTLDKYLSVVEGNAKDESAVRKVLVANNGEVVDTVVFGIGKINPTSITSNLVPTTAEMCKQYTKNVLT